MVGSIKTDLKGREERHAIRSLCAVLYLFIVLNMLGIGIDLHGEDKREAVLAAGEAVSEKPKIALTFDDGPNPACTGNLLDGLKKRGVKATFFVLGRNVKKYPKLVKRISEEGHRKPHV